MTPKSQQVNPSERHPVDTLLPAGSPLERLFERPDLPEFTLPAGLAAAYGGNMRFARPRVFANFVASVDGVVALPEGVSPARSSA